MNRWRGMLCCALAGVVPSNASVIVQLKVVEGDGAAYRNGSRASRGLTVLVTDEAGKPVERAAVSFKLPEEGPSGVFNSGLRTEVVNTGPDGRAAVGWIWNKTSGPVQIRITAIKDQARAGIISTQYLSDAVATHAGGEGSFTASHKGRTKWILIGLAAVAGGAAAGFVLARSHSPSSSTTAPAGVSIGTPSIIVGHP
jgi:hypothetical protein